jgi:GT2 family glycosyltransferase
LHSLRGPPFCTEKLGHLSGTGPTSGIEMELKEMKEESGKEGRIISVTVVICTHNRPLLLERCLKRLQQVDYPDFSVLVVDSAPQSSETKSLAARFGVKYEVSPLKGLSRARNIGARATKTSIIAYLDDDMIPHSGWLRSLIDEFFDDDIAAVTGPMLNLKFDDLIDADFQSQVDWLPWGPYRFVIDRSTTQWFERANFGGIGDGNFALRRNVFDQIRGFDERLGRGAVINASEEHYAYFKLIESGFKIVYAPQAIVFHPASLTTRDALRQKMAESVSYVAFMVFNHPSKSLVIIKFVIGGVFSARRRWRTSSRGGFASLSIQDMLWSGLSGFSAFLRSLSRRPN